MDIGSEKRLRVGVDMHVVDGKFQGSRSHLLELFSRIIPLDSSIDYYIFSSAKDQLIQFSKSFEAPNCHHVFMPHVNPLKRLFTVLPNLTTKYKIDILHTQYVIPFFTKGKVKKVVTIHDILFEKYPKYFTKLFTIRSKLFFYLSAKFSIRIFTVSNYSKKEIIDTYNIDDNKITVIYNGVSERFFPGSEGENLLTEIGLESKNYILTVGRLEPRKNHIGLLKAYSKLQNPPILVFVGQKDFSFNGIFNEIKKLKLEDKIRIIENINDQTLTSIYRHALLFAYPTFAEGFGMPVIEAMASGIPVITSNTTVLPEVAGDAAIHINPTNINQLADALTHLITSSTARNELIEKGFEQAKKFTWQISAERVLNVYKNYI